MPPEFDPDRLAAIIADHKRRNSGLIPLLQDVQEAFGYIPPESIESIAAALHLFPTHVQGVITFYAGFSLAANGSTDCIRCRSDGLLGG